MRRIVFFVLGALVLSWTAGAQELKVLVKGDNQLLGSMRENGTVFVSCETKTRFPLSKYRPPSWEIEDAPEGAHCLAGKGSGGIHIDSATDDSDERSAEAARRAEKDAAARKAAADRERATIKKMLGTEKRDPDDDDEDKH